MIPQTPSMAKSQLHRVDELDKYPPKTLLLSFDNWNLRVATITPKTNRNGSLDYVVWINGVTYENIYSGTSTTIDSSTTGLGGLVDGIAFTNGLDYLVWAFANEANNGFLGFGITRKPYSAFTGPASAAKGASVSFTGMTNCYQFTVGARVCVRNQVVNAGNPAPYNAAPVYEWNWGTVTAIVSNTSITVLMDNNASYGVALSGATSGEILQWNKFRPWVVTSTSQTLYSSNYRLVGYGRTLSANWTFLHTVTDEQFTIPSTDIYLGTAAVTNLTLSLGRWVPLWTKGAYLVVISASTVVAGHSIQILRRLGGDTVMYIYPQVASGTQSSNNETVINQYASVWITIAGASWSTNTIRILDYHLPEGFPE